MNDKNLTSDLVLRFGADLDLAEGVVVRPINFPSEPPPPPFKSTIFVVRPDCSTPLDHHEEAEMWVILNGEGLLKYEGVQSRVAQFDKIFFPSLTYHQIFNDSAVSLEILSIYWLTA
jgi:mannose-6-phosphate isomerase-like protein (cupin superfamily)